jgi:hypothetical protein
LKEYFNDIKYIYIYIKGYLERIFIYKRKKKVILFLRLEKKGKKKKERW